MSNKILCVGFTPALQRILTFANFRLGEVNRASTQELAPAGKGVNVAKVLKTLGSEPCVTGFLAGASGKTVARFLEELNIDARWLWHDGETRNAHTVIDDSTGEVTELVEEAVNPSDDLWVEALALIDRLLADARAVALCGALAPGSTPETYAKVIQLAHAQKVVCLVDAKGQVLDLALRERPFLVKMNTEELAYTTGGDTRSESEILEGIRKLKEAGAGHVLVTQGKEAAYLSDEDTFWRFVPPRVSALNPIGSGDSVTAGILHAYCSGAVLVEAVAYGIACGSANAETSRPAELHLERVNELVRDVKFSKLNAL